MQFKLILFFCLVLLLSVSIQAEIYIKKFPSLQGEYEYFDKKNVQFDMGVQFSSIQSASIEITAVGVNALLESCVYPIATSLNSPTFALPTCSTFQLAPQIFYQFENLSGLFLTGSLVVNTDTNEYMTTKDLLSETDLFLEGKGSLFITPDVLDQLGGSRLIDPWFEIKDITLTIEGETVLTTSSNISDGVPLESSRSKVQKMYIAYYGRPADNPAHL